MRFLLAHGNNSLSHLFKCLAVERELRGRGHEVLIATGAKHERFCASMQGLRYEVLPDIQEADGAGLPTVEWFRKKDRIIRCMQDEMALLERYRPERVLGVFRFTTKACCALTGTRYDSLICGCMLPHCSEVLGYANGEPGSDLQAGNLSGFYRYAGARLSRAMRVFGLGPIDDVRAVLKGERTFLWDFPAFLPLNASPGTIHVGPIEWDAWSTAHDIAATVPADKRLAIVSFGTCVGNGRVAERIVRLLRRLDYFVLIAAGNQCELMDLADGECVVSGTVPLSRIMPRASVIVTHGGQMTVFEALRHKVPVLVMPFQPEQAHTGVCLKRMGCGASLVGPQPFRGNSRVYIDAFMQSADDGIMEVIEHTATSAAIKEALEKTSREMMQYSGARAVAVLLEMAQ